MIQIKLVGTDSVEVDEAQPEAGKTAHILLPAYPNNDYADIRPSALVKLTPEIAQKMLKRMDSARKLVGEMEDGDTFDELVYFDYTPTCIDRSALVDFGTGSEELDILDDHIDDDSVLLTVDQAAQVEACPNAEVRVEICRLHVDCGTLTQREGNIYWTMRPKYSEYIVDTGMIPEDVLKRIAGEEKQ